LASSPVEKTARGPDLERSGTHQLCLSHGIGVRGFGGFPALRDATKRKAPAHRAAHFDAARTSFQNFQDSFGGMPLVVRLFLTKAEGA
jgi:hypothetical protein